MSANKLRDCGTYFPGVPITSVQPARFKENMKPQREPQREADFEKIMRVRYGMKVQTQRPNYRPDFSEIFYENNGC